MVSTLLLSWAALVPLGNRDTFWKATVQTTVPDLPPNVKEGCSTLEL